MVTIKDILKNLHKNGFNFDYRGNENAVISGYCMLSELCDKCITWAKKKAKVKPENFADKRGVLLVVPEYIENLSVNQIVTDIPKAVFFSTVNCFFVEKEPAFISEHSVIETDRLGKNVTVGHFTYICKDAEIEDDVVIGNNVSIVSPAHIGKGSKIGSGVVIGGIGFGLYEDANGIQQRVPHTGGVWIGENVEIDSNTCIDRGTIGDTIIEDNVKIDDLVMIAHNVHIKKNAVVTGCADFGGSSVIGENTYIAPGAIILNQLEVGDGAYVGVGSVVVTNIKAGKKVFGVPARSIEM